MTAIRDLLQQRGVMPLNQFKAEACAMIPAEATRYGRVSRRSIVAVWLKTYRRHISVADGNIQYCNAKPQWPESTSKPGQQMLATLKANGRITREQSGFKRETWNSYSRALRRLRWVVREGSGELVWCGPDDAEWSAVTRENSGRKKRNSTQEVFE